MPSRSLYSDMGIMYEPSTLGAAKMIDSLESYTVVPWDMGIVSETPLASFHFRTCNGIILLEKQKAAMAHLYTPRCISSHLEKLLVHFEHPVAVISPSTTYAQSFIQRKLAESQIPTIASSVASSSYEPRDIIVFPAEQEVRMYSQSGSENVFRRD